MPTHALLDDITHKVPADQIGTHSHDPSDVTGTALIATAFVGLAKITVGTSQPGSPGVGDLWVDTN